MVESQGDERSGQVELLHCKLQRFETVTGLEFLMLFRPGWKSLEHGRLDSPVFLGNQAQRQEPVAFQQPMSTLAPDCLASTTQQLAAYIERYVFVHIYNL